MINGWQLTMYMLSRLSLDYGFLTRAFMNGLGICENASP